jgi:hypothetical protein
MLTPAKTWHWPSSVWCDPQHSAKAIVSSLLFTNDTLKLTETVKAIIVTKADVKVVKRVTAPMRPAVLLSGSFQSRPEHTIIGTIDAV